MQNDEAAARYRAGSGAVFSSTQCPPSRDHTCELPFGFLYTPLAPSSSSSTLDAFPTGLLCLTCLGYLNLYAAFDEAKNLWTCSLCGAKNAVPSFSPALQTALRSPILEVRQSLPPVENPSPQYIVLLDEHLSLDDARQVGQILPTVLPRETSLGLIVYGETVRIYHLGVSGLASADVYDDEQWNPDRPYWSTFDDASFALCLMAVYGIEDADSAPPQSRLERLKQEKQARLRGTLAPPKTPPKQRPVRNFGLALQCAMDLSAEQTTRLLVFTNGHPNFGPCSVGEPLDPFRIPRAVEYVDVWAKAAEHMGVDVFLCGSSALCLPFYQALVEPSGGYAIAYETYGEALSSDLKFSLGQTYLSRVNVHDRETPTGGRSEMWMDGCVVDIRLSR